MHAYRELVHRCIDCGRIRSRLSRYPAIARHFPESVLKSCSDQPPYYCHYMAWCLGTWLTEIYPENMERMLSAASLIDNWQQEFRQHQNSCDFSKYWSLLWQMQVADFFKTRGARLSWNPAGPDLSVEDLEGQFFVECYAYQKSYPIEEFIHEVLRCVDERIRVEHRAYLPFSLPKNGTTAGFLDELFQSFLKPGSVDQALQAAARCWPHLFPVPSGAENFFVYIEGPSDAYQPGVLPNYTGDPPSYLQDCISKAIGNKQDKNKLATHRPNLLAVNCLLSDEFFMAEQRQKELSERIPEPDLGSNLDAVLFTSTGVDKPLSQVNICSRSEIHPVVAWLQRNGLIESEAARKTRETHSHTPDR